jgi:hypothetical protein
MEQPCNCHNEISSKATDIFRLTFIDVSPENTQKLLFYKKELAKLYTSLDGITPTPSVDHEGTLSEWITATESIYEAKRHLQLASYYITHALTSNAFQDNTSAVSENEH